MAKIYYNSDTDLKVLSNEVIAVLGYGSQGHAQAQNMKDSGLNVIIGLPKTSKSFEQAKNDGFEVYTPDKACKKATIIQVLTPDTIQAKLYDEVIKPNLTTGKALVFSHGFNIHYGFIVPPKDVDVYMVAPKGPGHLVRRVFKEGGGVPSLIAVYQDATGKAHKRALAHAASVGAGRAGILETTFKDETETDLFGEQTVLCGGLSKLIMYSFETLVEAGYDPDIAYFECLHELKLITDLIYEGGLARMLFSISDTAEYGAYKSGPVLIDSKVKESMKKVLDDIQKSKGAKFANEWMEEAKNGYSNFYKLRETNAKHQVEIVGQKLRSMMSFLNPKK